MAKTKDKYDKAIEYLTAHPDEISAAWWIPGHHKAGCLFQFVSKDGGRDEGDSDCGCLTGIRLGIKPAATEALTSAIRADKRIPTDPSDITIETLPVFAEWHRRIDKELNRV